MECACFLSPGFARAIHAAGFTAFHLKK